MPLHHPCLDAFLTRAQMIPSANSTKEKVGCVERHLCGCQNGHNPRSTHRMVGFPRITMRCHSNPRVIAGFLICAVQLRSQALRCVTLTLNTPYGQMVFFFQCAAGIIHLRARRGILLRIAVKACRISQIKTHSLLSANENLNFY
jgi:hypothetical protein